jgi:flagellar motor switch protein FliN/FliY
MSTPPHTIPGPVQAFARLWTESIAGVLGQIASAPFPMQEVPAENMPGPAASDVQLTITAAGTVRGEMNLRLPPATALDLAKLFMGDADLARSEVTADDRSALEELFRQITGHVSTSARPKGLEMPLTVVLGEAPTWSPGASGWISSGQGAPRSVQIEWKLSSALATALVTTWHEPEVAAAAATAPASGAPDAAKFDLLMDLELDVTLRFGGRNIMLKEILELGPGAVLELDRNIQNDADLLLDGKVIARGKVVVVEGNFGLRITEALTGKLYA